MRRIFLLYIVLALFLVSCAENEPIERDIFAMDTMMSIRIWGSDDTLNNTCDIIRNLDELLDAQDEQSEIYRLNQDGVLSAHNDVIEILRLAISYCEKTNGCFDPTVYPAVLSWKEAESAPPSAEELQAFLPLIGIENISANGSNITLKDGTMLDFGAIAKGYAAQKCIDYLKNNNVESAIISLGGNVQTLGSKPDGSKWAVGIADPSNPSKSIAIVKFEGSMALVTSGSYQRYYELDGVKYHHILDPKTLYPAENELASVTILALNGTMADAYSTALFVMGLDKAVEFWKSQSDFDAVFILKDGSIFATQGAAPLLSGCNFTEIKR